MSRVRHYLKYMRKQTSLKYFSRLLLMVMLTVMVNGAHECAHAMQTDVTAARGLASNPEISAAHECPCAPLEQHNDYDGCDKCVNCVCHASLAIQPFQISYNPIILDLNTFASFNFLPAVYLSLFVPPDSVTV